MKIPKKLPETDKEKIAAWREIIPDLFRGSYRKQYDKAMTGRAMRAAINSKCLECMSWQQAEVRDCHIVICPLHPYRPYQSRRDRPVSSNLAQQNAIRGGGEEKKAKKRYIVRVTT